MKRLLLLLTLLFTTVIADAQQSSWKIKLNKKKLLSTTIEDENKNKKKITSAEWKKTGYLEIAYTEPDPDFWYRSFLFYDEEDNQLFATDSLSKVRIPVSQLRKIFAGKKELRIYLGGSPRDPNVAVRMRRVHLCTLKLQ